MASRVEYLIVDTSAFIKNTQLQEFGENIITTDEVVHEVKSVRQLRRLVVLPYDLQMKEPDPEDVIFVTEFSKKTGDYPCLSATDIRVIALTYKYERELVGTDHLRKEPVVAKKVLPLDSSVLNDKDIVGFYQPEGESQEEDEGIISNGEDCSDASEVETNSNCNEDDDSSEGEYNTMEQEVPVVDDLISNLNRMCVNDVTKETECDQTDPCAIDSDEAGWITPSNLKFFKKGYRNETFEEDSVKVACLTTDYAMQNVLKQIGLQVVSLDGLVISELRTFILRCYGCFKTTSNMTKVFCPKCGNKTLKKVAVTIDEEGKEQIYVNFKRPLTARGKRFPLPRFHGGKHSNNPILSEDQRVPQQLPSKLARAKNDPLDPDYIAGISPFVTRDIWSKSAALGVTTHSSGKMRSWMRKNPNEVVKRRRKK